MEITEAEEHIEKYRTELKEFCKSLSISLCLEERFSSIPHLQCQTVTLLFDWEPEEHLLKDIMELLAKVSGKLLRIEYTKRTKSICVTCSFPFSDVGFTVLRMIENIHILMGQGLKKLTIGNLTLWRRQDVRQKELKEKDQDLLQHTEVISYIILEEAEYKLRDATSSKEKEAIELKQELSKMKVLTELEAESLFIQSDTESVKEVEEEPLYEELTALRSKFNEIKDLPNNLSKMKIEYLRSLSSNTDSAASRVRRGMSFEIDDCQFHLKAMTSPDYQPLVDNKRIIEKLQERITLMTEELITEREHNEKIIKDIKDHLEEIEEKRQREMKRYKLYCNHPVTGKLIESTLEVHKDELLPSVLDKAYELMKLAPHIPIERCRLVEYDDYNHAMNRSFDLDEFQHQTIGQLMDVTGYYYDLFLETRKENETFKKYNHGGVNLEISVVDLAAGKVHVGPAIPMRGESGWTVGVLKQHIGEVFNISPSCMRVAWNENWNGFCELKDEESLLLYKSRESKLLYVSSDPKDYKKEFKDSLMYRYVEFHVNSMLLLNITIPPGPEATPTITERRMMKIISIIEENKGKERKIQVRVSKSITLIQLKEELVPLIGVRPTGFRVYEIIGNREYELEALNQTLKDIGSGSKLIVRLGRALGRGEKRIKLYLLQVNNTEFCKFMMDTGYAMGTPVGEFKKQIIEEAKVQGIDCVLELDKMRLHNKNGVSPGTVYLDHEFIDTSSKEMYVDPLKGPGKKKHDEQRQVYVIRWRPSQCSVDPIEEIILDDYGPEHVIGKLSELSGVPAEYIYYTEGKSFPVKISCLDIENKLRWYSITSDRYSLRLYDDGGVIYYKDKRETMKELTYEERSAIQEAEEARLEKIRECELQH
uniref:Ubiquitin carboxyl-terminal hydrolase 47 C-terminal domain-containing protein n=1 Tax=Amphimedon queenslandica TaxID=400682 RepID=A0A1X7U3H3_AMPQE